jgi:hypothetical protein
MKNAFCVLSEQGMIVKSLRRAKCGGILSFKALKAIGDDPLPRVLCFMRVRRGLEAEKLWKSS